jgi:hypothetical protein
MNIDFKKPENFIIVLLNISSMSVSASGKNKQIVAIQHDVREKINKKYFEG